MPVDVGEGGDVHVPAAEHAAGGVKGALTKRIGPLPVWGWAAVALVGAFVVVPFLRGRAAGAASSGTGAASPSSGGGAGSVLPPGDTGQGGTFFPSSPDTFVSAPGGGGNGTPTVLAPSGGATAQPSYPFQPGAAGGGGAPGSGIQQTGPSSALITVVDRFAPGGGTNTAPLPGVFTGNDSADAPLAASYSGVIASESPSAGAVTAYDLGQFQQIANEQAAAANK